MEATDRPTLAARLLKLTQEMLSLARAGDWSAFAQCEQERRSVCRELFATPVPDEEAPAVAERIRGVLELDQALIELATQGRAEASHALRGALLGQRAIDTYQRFSH